MDMDTFSLYLALAEKEKYDCIRSEKRQEWDFLRSKDCDDSFTADACSKFLPWKCCAKLNGTIKDSLDCSRKNFDSLKSVCVARHTAVTTL